MRQSKAIKAAAKQAITEGLKSGELERVVDAIGPSVPHRDAVLSSDKLSSAVVSVKIVPERSVEKAGSMEFSVEVTLSAGLPVEVAKSYKDFQTLNEEIMARLAGLKDERAVNALEFPAGPATLSLTSYIDQEKAMIPQLNAFLAQVAQLQSSAETRPSRKAVEEALGRFLDQAHVETVVGTVRVFRSLAKHSVVTLPRALSSRLH
eukprot:SAG31_NODE_5030_length_2793_cov_1.858575_4_plen_206_part_00